MNRFIRSALAAIAILGIATSSVALAQTAPRQDPGRLNVFQSTERALDDISKWTTKEWNQAKAKWAAEKAKWADCRKRSKDQKRVGRKSWSFLASCMTS
jgi:hypothetical protein